MLGIGTFSIYQKWSHFTISNTIEEFSSKIKQIHFWYFWEKTGFFHRILHMSMGIQNLDLKKEYLRELSWF